MKKKKNKKLRHFCQQNYPERLTREISRNTIYVMKGGIWEHQGRSRTTEKVKLIMGNTIDFFLSFLNCLIVEIKAI